jgi:hypothetical protein
VAITNVDIMQLAAAAMDAVAGALDPGGATSPAPSRVTETTIEVTETIHLTLDVGESGSTVAEIVTSVEQSSCPDPETARCEVTVVSRRRLASPRGGTYGSPVHGRALQSASVALNIVRTIFDAVNRVPPPTSDIAAQIESSGVAAVSTIEPVSITAVVTVVQQASPYNVDPSASELTTIDRPSTLAAITSSTVAAIGIDAEAMEASVHTVYPPMPPPSPPLSPPPPREPRHLWPQTPPQPPPPPTPPSPPGLPPPPYVWSPSASDILRIMASTIAGLAVIACVVACWLGPKRKDQVMPFKKQAPTSAEPEPEVQPQRHRVAMHDGAVPTPQVEVVDLEVEDLVSNAAQVLGGESAGAAGEAGEDRRPPPPAPPPLLAPREFVCLTLTGDRSGGLGIGLNSTFEVIEVLPGGPAQRGGIELFDQLVEINQISIHARSPADIISSVPSAAPLALGVRRVVERRARPTLHF